MYELDPKVWKERIHEFDEASKAYYAGELPRAKYKGTSGFFGSYAQREDGMSMIRLRMIAGRITKEKLKFIADTIRKYNIKRAHFTTCEAVQLHDITSQPDLCAIMESAIDVRIVTLGGGGDYPRNIICSPLSGVQKDEYFDVMPYAELVGDYMMTLLNLPKMPRKLKVCFSNSPENIPHATFRDLGFTARPDGKFDVFSAGGIGPNPKMGVPVAEAVDPSKILYYINGMYNMFCAHGDYESRAKARTRYMQERLGGTEPYKEAYLAKVAEVMANESLDITVEPIVYDKKGDGTLTDPRAIEQKQPGLYSVCWHPIGGMPDVNVLCALSDAVQDMDQVEVRLSADEGAYIINLTAKEAEKVLDIIEGNNAETVFETSVACVGGSTCQQGIRDSQKLLAACVKAVREVCIPDGALPKVRISGCPSSCTAHQIGEIGFRGAAKKVDGKMESAFQLFIDGNDYQGKEVITTEKGVILEADIPEFLVKVGKAVQAAGCGYHEWRVNNPGALEEIAAPYIAE